MARLPPALANTLATCGISRTSPSSSSAARFVWCGEVPVGKRTPTVTLPSSTGGRKVDSSVPMRKNTPTHAATAVPRIQPRRRTARVAARR